jgi:hypothetical protein
MRRRRNHGHSARNAGDTNIQEAAPDGAKSSGGDKRRNPPGRQVVAKGWVHAKTVSFGGRFRRLPMRAFPPPMLLAAALVVAASSCSQKKTAVLRSGLETLDGALAPDDLVAALREAGGGHFRSTSMFRVDGASHAEADDGTEPASPSAVTTTTDLWMDKQGNFRLVENNDQDGGREIVRVGGEVAVALRYGKRIRRSAQDAENARFLAEALGAPWAAWEIVRRQVNVDEAGQGAYRLRLGTKLTDLPSNFATTQGLRKWRDAIEVRTLEGQAALAFDGRLPVAFTCKTTFRAARDQGSDKVPVVGEVAVSAAFDQLGKVADIAMPEAEPLHLRQRTVLEEKALLGGLSASLVAPGKKTGP